MRKLFQPKIIILLCTVVCLFITTNIHWGKDKWQNIIEADARGYYAYLPAVFIYQDLNFTFYDSVETAKYNSHFNYDYRVKIDNSYNVNKYYCGTAIAQSPFFLTAHILTLFSDYEADGYSRIYMLFITLAGIFYMLAGLIFTDKLLRLYHISNGIRSFTLLAILFGTNLFFYTVCEMGMSHIYSFALIAAFCFYMKKLFITSDRRYMILSMIILGFIFLVRPANLLVLMAVPFLAGDMYYIFKGTNILKKNFGLFATGFLALAGIISIQLLIYKISSGHLWVDSYPSEEFNFKDPHFFLMLFSYKKGLFLYTPLYLLSLFGLYYFYQRRRFEFFSFLVFFVILTYILSSWWNWWYGGSFSSRVFVDYLSLFSILLALQFQNASKKIFRRLLVPSVIAMIALCQFQTYQYRYYLIHWEDMTKEKYWDVFLSMKKEGKR